MIWQKQLATLLIAVTGLMAFGAGELPDEFLFNRVKLTYSSENTPTARAGTTGSVASAKGALHNRWVVFSVDYYPNHKISKTRNAWVDDVTLTLRAVFDGISQGRKVTCVFSGKTEFMTIPIDGRRHVALMMIPPQLLDRYLPPGGSGSTISGNTISAEAVFTDSDGKIAGIGFCNVKGSSLAQQRQAFAKMLQGKSNIVRDGVILSKDESPWRWIDFSDYDYIKPSCVKKENNL